MFTDYEYKLQIKHQSTYFVAVFKIKDKFAEKEEKRLEWIVDLEGDDDSIIFCELYEPTKFLVMSCSGRLRAYDIETKNKIFDHNFHSAVSCKAVLNKIRNRLYVSVEPDDEDPKIIVFDLPSLNQMEEINLPSDVDAGQILP